ncbi:MAG: T9SS type A sorting domain-containing protein [Bacteroidales bacterium]|nr:T9SS type A sorting domain-containing protein [Bacteroidales bacterium]
MKHFYTISLTTFLFISVLQTQAQQYFAFPSEDASWHCLNWIYVPDMMNQTWNYTYTQNGDTIIESRTYHKIYVENTYIGGIREDGNKQIFFFPESLNSDFYDFPNNTEEHLLYSFNDLEAGMDIEIGEISVHIQSIDSILLNNYYRKRYHVYGTMLFEEHWIEGIGSDKDLFSVYSHGEFENTLFTLCFTDTETYYINSPNGQDSCHYQAPVGISNINTDENNFYPNPITDYLNIRTIDYPSHLYIYNISGQLLLTKDIKQENTKIDFSAYPNGIYFIELKQNNKITRKKIIK